MANKSYLGSITKYCEIGEGSNAYVYYADYFGGRTVAYKEFCDSEYVKLIKDNLMNLTEKGYDNDILIPDTFIYKMPKDDLFKGYITELFIGKTITDKYNMNYEDKIKILKEARKLVEKFHDKYNSIHCDITPWNFILPSSEHMKLIDFDTTIDLNNKNMNENLYWDGLLEYFKNNGVDKDADIFMFNMLTYSLINDKDFYGSLSNMIKNDYGYIESSKARKIIDTYKDFDKPKSIKKEYIIDYL